MVTQKLSQYSDRSHPLPIDVHNSTLLLYLIEMAGSDYKYVMYDGDLVVFDTHGVNDVRVISGNVENVNPNSRNW